MGLFHAAQTQEDELGLRARHLHDRQSGARRPSPPRRSSLCLQRPLSAARASRRGRRAQVKSLTYPWRSIVDGGVVLGLTVGVSSIFFHYVRALRGVPVPASPELP